VEIETVEEIALWPDERVAEWLDANRSALVRYVIERCAVAPDVTRG
jgi:hypothetical protein